MMNLLNSRFHLTQSHLSFGLAVISLVALVLGGSAGARWT